MKLIRESRVVPAHRGTATLSVVLREQPRGDGATEYVVHWRNHDDGGYSDGLYTTDLTRASQEFDARVARL